MRRLLPTSFVAVMPMAVLMLTSVSVADETNKNVNVDANAGVKLPRPLAHWKLDETSGNVAKDSAGKHNGKVVGATPVKGRLGGARLFQRAKGHHIAIPYSKDLDITTFTVSAWVRLTKAPTFSGILGTRFGKDFTFDLKVNAAKVHGDIGTGKEWIETKVNFYEDDGGSNGHGGKLSLDRWYHVTYVIDTAKSECRLYLDADLKKTIAFQGTPRLMQPGQQMRIGNSSSDEYMDGVIDDVRIWSSALSATQVQYLFRSTKPLTRILFGSCAKEFNPLPILNSVVADQPDAFVFLGDNIYADTTDMKVMQAKYDKLRSHRSFQSLRKACPILATWDDHDYGMNDAGASYPKRREAQKLFVEFWRDPPHSARRKRPGVYESQVFGPEGKRVQFLVLDTRYFRSPLAKGPRRLVGGPYTPSLDKSATMLGDAQWKWLEEQLRRPAEVRIIATSIQCVAEASGQETWSNFPLERKRLFDLIAKTRANGVVMISGDRHWAELSSTGKKTAYPLFDVTSSSFNQIHKRGTPTKNDFRISPTTYHKENYGEINIDWNSKSPTISLRIKDLEGKTKIERTVRLDQLQHQ